ncbi:Mitotic checkpoint protein BUB3.3 [Euphorbia peplus]|nr:Mitotic checkpoint protein BUB3.3 [Euphorbia peplus]
MFHLSKAWVGSTLSIADKEIEPQKFETERANSQFEKQKEKEKGFHPSISFLSDLILDLTTCLFNMSLHFENPIGDAVSRIHFAPESNNLLISSWDSNLRLYNVDDAMLRLEVPCQAALLDCCFQSESAAFSVDSDGCVRRYDLHSETNDIVGSHHDIATCVGYSDITSQVISASLDKNIMVWDTRSAQSLVHLMNLGAEVESMSLSGSYLMVAVGTSVNIYDLRNSEKAVEWKESCTDVKINCITSFPYSKGYAVGSIDGRVALDFLSASEKGYTFRCHPKSNDGMKHLASINDIAFSPRAHGNFITGDNHGNIIEWDKERKRRLYEFPKFPNSVASLSFNSSGELLAIASSCTYQEANKMESPPQIFIQKIDDI